MSTPVYLFSLSTHPDTINIKSLDVSFFKPKIDFSKYDYLILTSKQAVESLKQYKNSQYLRKEALAVSKKTAQAYESLGGKILECAEGYGSNIATKIIHYPKTTKWLYLRASVVASNFTKECRDDGYTIDEAIVYQSECSKDITNAIIPKNAVLIFTSPSSVLCYLKSHTISEQNRVIVIGSTTAKKLPNGLKYTISNETSIQSCVDLLS